MINFAFMNAQNLLKEPEVRVGLYTAGEAIVEQCGDVWLLHNLLIGKDFHWQRTLEARLPGRLVNPSEEARGEGVGLVNILGAEQYLKCVAGSEMSPEAPAEFLKAHAIIARSWLLHKLSGQATSFRQRIVGSATQNDGYIRLYSTAEICDWDDTVSHRGFDVCSDDHCQRYQGIQPLSVCVTEAIDSTRGVVIIDGEGHIADARYSKCCGGFTEDFSVAWGGDTPDYLRGHRDGYCDFSNMSESVKRRFLTRMLKGYDRNPEPFGIWQREISKQEVTRHLREKFGRDIGDVTDVKVSRRGHSGRASQVKVTGTAGSLLIGKELMVRRLLSPTHLYSSLIEIETRPESFVIRGRGWGHGVGLCQIGAARMADSGAGCEEILGYYYPGTSLRRMF